MTLSCKEVTATMAQELEQPIYVKPNRGDAYEFDSGEWKTVSGVLGRWLEKMKDRKGNEKANMRILYEIIKVI